MLPASSCLVLFDIDGTLVRTGRAGLRGMNAAFLSLYGLGDALEGVPVAGRTDHGIVGDVLRRIGRDASDAEIARVRERYVEELAIEIVRPVPDPVEVLP